MPSIYGSDRPTKFVPRKLSTKQEITEEMFQTVRIELPRKPGVGIDLSEEELDYCRSNLVKLDFLIKNGADPKWVHEYKTVLYVAVTWNNVPAVEYLLKLEGEKKIDIDYKCEDGGLDRDTALYCATKLSHTSIVKKLLDAGADPNITNKVGRTPLEVASQNGDVEIVRALLSAGGKVNIANKISGDTPLIQAVFEGHKEIIHMLLEAGADVNARTKCYGRQQAIHMAAQKGRLEIFFELLERGADINSKDDYGHTSLSLAAGKGFTLLVRKILEYGVNNEYDYVAPNDELTRMHTIYEYIPGEKVLRSRSMYDQNISHEDRQIQLYKVAGNHLPFVKALQNEHLDIAILVCQEQPPTTRNQELIKEFINPEKIHSILSLTSVTLEEKIIGITRVLERLYDSKENEHDVQIIFTKIQSFINENFSDATCDKESLIAKLNSLSLSNNKYSNELLKLVLEHPRIAKLSIEIDTSNLALDQFNCPTPNSLIDRESSLECSTPKTNNTNLTPRSWIDEAYSFESLKSPVNNIADDTAFYNTPHHTESNNEQNVEQLGHNGTAEAF